MEFAFHLSPYDAPFLEEEAARLLAQRLEAHSREAVPGLWKAVDNLNAYAAKGPGRETRRTRYRVYGAVLIALGIFVLVPGWGEPGTPSIIGGGTFGFVSVILSFCITRKKRAPSPPASCRKEAARLLSQRRSVDWTLPENRTELRFDEAGLAILAGGKDDAVPYGEMTAVYEAERLWLLLCGGEQAILLQKKDLTKGDAAEFAPCLREKITAK